MYRAKVISRISQIHVLVRHVLGRLVVALRLLV